MAKKVIICFIMLNSAAVFGQLAEFGFSDRVHKFDTTTEGEVLSHRYPFINSGDAPLVIAKHKVACECTQVTYPNQPILPGDTASIYMTFDSKGKIGWQYRTIELFANTKKSPTEIEFRVKVVNQR
ncbi:MAG: DUF1573 domain-containing protein [Flavobacteriales bacterium]|nr:DUF1573 domain-containing protein [Flavobacteriales bacterium]